MFNNFYLNVELTSENAKCPTRACPSDAGLDLYTPKTIVVPAGGDLLVPLDIRVEFPEGYAMIVKEKSGIATKKKLDVGACVIDAGYRGICHVHLFNNSKYDVTFLSGEKIAQAVIIRCWTGDPAVVDTVDLNTVRGEGGFGHTGA